MQNLSEIWESFTEKTKIWDVCYLIKNENFIKWLEDFGFYGEGSTAQYNDNAWGIDLYYVNINVFKLILIDDMIIIETQPKLEFANTRFNEHKGVKGNLDNEKYRDRRVKIDDEEEIEELKQWILKIKNLLLNHLTSKIKINSLELENFKLFEEEEIQFKSNFTVLIGDNGSGKTSILEAVAISVSRFLFNFTKSTVRNITNNDVRLKGYILGDEYRFEEQYPVSVGGSYNFGTYVLQWTRMEYGKPVRMRYSPFKSTISLLAKELRKEIRNGNETVVLPVFAYYGTGRMWVVKDVKDEEILSMEKISRTYGYNKCLKAQSDYEQFIKWFKLMKFKEFQLKKEMPGFKAVCNGIETIISNVLNVETEKIKIDYDGTDIVIKFSDETVKPLRLLSDGYKNVIGMVADIAHRMYILNPQLGVNVLKQTSGIVLIDEIDLHLHPKWQRHIVRDLRTVFPKVQFIVTTHSPNILTTIEKESVIILEDNKVVENSPYTYGRDVNSILYELMEVGNRPEEVQKQIDEFYVLLDNEDYEGAEKKLQDLTEILGDHDSEIVRARAMLDFER